MGCDIHLYTEAFETVNGVPQWVNVDNWRLNKYHGTDADERKYDLVAVYDRRDYSLFAVLAGVRDYSDSGNPVIADPRGLPEDVSAETKAESDRWDGDGHTHSWLTLLELRQYFAKHPNNKEAGLISLESAARLDAGVLPERWCQGTTEKNVVRREWEMPNTGLEKLIKGLDERARDVFWIFGDDPVTDEIAAKIRIVFWFDN